MVGITGGVVVEGLLSGRELFSLSWRWVASLAFAFVLLIEELVVILGLLFQTTSLSTALLSPASLLDIASGRQLCQELQGKV